MRVLVVGSGGREHALVWKLARSPSVTKVFCAPGNAGTLASGENVPIEADNLRELVRFATKERIELAVIGPEAPLVAGLADLLRREGIAVFGPSKEAALLEGSKVFCKRLMRKANIPTADFHVFSEMPAVEAYLEAHAGPCVVKADGLAAGKGAIVCDDEVAARAAARRMLVDKEFGEAGRQILIEERLEGVEVSVLAITDGATILVLDPCQDYKRACDGDQGPNTGGMGAFCPAPRLTPELLTAVEREVLVPIVHFLKRERRPFRGVLYAGIMLTATGIKVLEFNVRFGDPETQPLMLRLQSDLGELLYAAAVGRLDELTVEWDARPAVCVVLASGGYPAMYKRGLPIRGIEQAGALADVVVFHAGTRLDNGRVVTNGGRVLGVTALGADLAAARAAAYRGVAAIGFTVAAFRTDIALTFPAAAARAAPPSVENSAGAAPADI